jgi:hypothetical protein
MIVRCLRCWHEWTPKSSLGMPACPKGCNATVVPLPDPTEGAARAR